MFGKTVSASTLDDSQVCWPLDNHWTMKTSIACLSGQASKKVWQVLFWDELSKYNSKATPHVLANLLKRCRCNMCSVVRKNQRVLKTLAWCLSNLDSIDVSPSLFTDSKGGTTFFTSTSTKFIRYVAHRHMCPFRPMGHGKFSIHIRFPEQKVILKNMLRLLWVSSRNSQTLHCYWWVGLHRKTTVYFWIHFVNVPWVDMRQLKCPEWSLFCTPH